MPRLGVRVPLSPPLSKRTRPLLLGPVWTRLSASPPQEIRRRGLDLYKQAAEVLCKTILPYVVGIHGMDIPYSAELIHEDGPISESGSVVFRLDERGSFVAEYFAYGVHPFDAMHLSQSLGDKSVSVRLVDTGVELPVHSVSPSRKTGTIHNHVAMPLVSTVECTVFGWVGDPTLGVKSAVATLDGCAILPLLSSSERSFLSVGQGNNRFPSSSYYDARTTEVIELTAGGWEVTIHSRSEDKRDSLSDEAPYSVSIRRAEGSTFQLSGQLEALRLLALLLSFSSERWVQYSTVYGQMPGARPVVVNRAFVGRFSSRGWSRKREVSILELRDWPIMFKGLWSSRESPQMLSALTHLISCGDRSKHGAFSYQDLVDACGALEAAVRLWNGLPPNHFFRSRGASSLKSHLRRVVSEFRMGGRMLDLDEVIKVVPRAYKYRHTLAHGSGGKFHRAENEESGTLIAHHQYLYHLARLLALARLGGTSGHPGTPYYAPTLIDA